MAERTEEVRWWPKRAGEERVALESRRMVGEEAGWVASRASRRNDEAKEEQHKEWEVVRDQTFIPFGNLIQSEQGLQP